MCSGTASRILPCMVYDAIYDALLTLCSRHPAMHKYGCIAKSYRSVRVEFLMHLFRGQMFWCILMRGNKFCCCKENDSDHNLQFAKHRGHWEKWMQHLSYFVFVFVYLPLAYLCIFPSVFVYFPLVYLCICVFVGSGKLSVQFCIRRGQKKNNESKTCQGLPPPSHPEEWHHSKQSNCFKMINTTVSWFTVLSIKRSVPLL